MYSSKKPVKKWRHLVLFWGYVILKTLLRDVLTKITANNNTIFDED